MRELKMCVDGIFDQIGEHLNTRDTGPCDYIVLQTPNIFPRG